MKKKFRYSILCLAIAFTLCVAQFGSVVAGMGAGAASEDVPSLSAPSMTVQDEGVVRPENIDEGLSTKSLQDIRGRRVTVRQPVMEVINDSVDRPKDVPVLGDTYLLGDFDSRKPLHPLASVTFEGTEGDAKSENPKYPMKGLANSPKSGEGEQKYFSCYEKYMLLRQAYYFNQHAMEIVKEGHLVKHPAADYIYGKIDDDAKAVTMHIVTDPIYRSPMTTGLYLVPGEKATLKIRGLGKGETLILYTHHQDTLGYRGYNEEGNDLGSDKAYFAYWDKKIVEIAEKAEAEQKTPDFTTLSYGLQGQWVWQNQKVPCMGTTFTITGDGTDEMTVDIGSMYGGPLYVKPTTGSVDFTVTGAVLTPHFVLGVTTVEDFNKYYRNAPGLIATLDVENGQLIGPAVDMKNADDIEKLAYFWHSVFAIDISLNGREYNYNMTMCYDMHVPAGEAVALNSNFCAQPTYWFDTCMNYEELTTNGNWGTFHELGHVQAKTYGVNWGFAEGDGEVWNNTLILIIYSMLCNMDNRLAPVEHGEYVHPFTAIERSQKITQTYEKDGETIKIDDYGKINNGNGAHFDQLSMYATLLHSFGPEKFIDMFYTYKLDPAYCENKRADFVYRIALVDRVNIFEWVNANYFANISEAMFSESQLEFLHSLPTFYPVAYRWANGVDGNETARKYEVDGKHGTVFDLSAANFTSPKEVKVLGVTKPEHGETLYDEKGQKVTYKPPKTVTEYDSFDILVSTYGGRQVTLNVRFKLLYRGVHTEVWDLGTPDEQRLHTKSPSVELARQYCEKLEPTSTETGSVAGKGNFTHSNMEYFRSTFQFTATKAGKHTFYLRADDAACVKFYKGHTSATNEPTHTLNSWSKYDFSETDSGRKWEVDLKVGETVFVAAELVNWGGLGNLHIGLRMPGDTGEIQDIPIANISNAGVTEDELRQADAFTGWQPRFVDSIKDVTMDSQVETKEWAILEAPVNENGSGPDHLIDGDPNTIYHSRHSNNVPPVPHVIVIDTKKNQEFNFFEVLRRSTNTNDQLLEYELYGMKDEGTAYDKDAMGGDHNERWTLLYKGTAEDPRAAYQRMSFEKQELRWFKFVVRRNNGHTVIKELYAGLESKLNQTVKPSAYGTKNGNTNFTENSANGKLTAKSEGAMYEFAFLGSGFELYADTNPAYGKATVTVDKKEVGTIDLCAPAQFNRCVFQSGELELGEHVVTVKTTTALNFNISFINVVYGTPVDEEDYPALLDANGQQDFGNTDTPRLFTREWRTLVKDYKSLTSIKFLDEIPAGYKDTYRRIDEYIRVYRDENDANRIAFVYPGTILAPTECGSLFAGCEKLTELDFGNFDTSSMRGASSMFNGCAALTSIDVKSLQTENVQSMGAMFAGCVRLNTLDLSTFTLADNVNLGNMFDSCLSLTKITLPEKIAEKATSGLPGIFRDETTDEFTTSVTSKNAGHVLSIHNTHTFSGGKSEPIVEPTCTETGLRAYRECTVCHFHFDPNAHDELLTEKNKTIPAKGHDTEWVLGETMPTCTKPGGSYKLVCTVCGEVLEDDGGFPAMGHFFELDLGEGHEKGYVLQCNADGTASLIFYFKCGNFDYSNYDPEDPEGFMDLPLCGQKETVTVTLQCVDRVSATCTTNATYTFRQVVTKEDVLAVLNPEGKGREDHITGFDRVSIDEQIVLEGSFGHSYGSPVFTWRENNTKAQATFTCTREGCPETAEGHTMSVEAAIEQLERVDATCLTEAYVRYTATARLGESEYSETQHSTEQNSKKPHSYTGACQQVGDDMHAQMCVNGCEQFGTAVACTAQETWHITDAAHYKMCVCGRHLSESAHAFAVHVEWPETAEKVQELSSAFLTCEACGTAVHEGLSLTVTQKAGSKAATCEEEGSVVYTATVRYGGRDITLDSEPYAAPKLGHNYAPATKAPLTWAAEGQYAEAALRLACTNCREGDPNHTKDVSLSAEVDVSGGGTAATCGSTADKIVYKVDPTSKEILDTIRNVLGDSKFDESAVKALQALEHTESSSMVGHDWRLVEGELTLKWKVDEDASTATLTETFKCSRCNAEFVLVFEGECTVTVATCESGEQLTFTVGEKGVDEIKAAANESSGGVSLYANDTYQALPRRQYQTAGKNGPLNHVYEDVAAVDPTCTREGSTAGRRCTRAGCGHTEGIETIAPLGHKLEAIEDIPATCVTSGATGGERCSVCKEILRAQTEVAPLGHSEHANNDGVAATCTEQGWTDSTSCSVCGMVVREREAIPAKGHTVHENSDGVEATCTEAGRTNSTSCSECGATVHAGEVIPAKGHHWETLPGKAPTATEPGLTEGEYCTECGEVRKAQTEIAPLGSDGPNMGMIVGIAGGVAAVVVIGAVVIVLIKKRRRTL